MSSRKGLFVTFEGGEGAGKSSVIRFVKEQLEGKGLKVLSLREPGGTVLGEKIRDLLLNAKANITLSGRSELLLFLASRSQLIEESILPALKEGAVVLCDRYNDSTVAYQGEGRGLGLRYVETICDLVTSEAEPDLTLLLDLPAAVGLKRAKSAHKELVGDRFESEAIEFHEKIRKAYLHLLEEYPHRMVLLDAELPLESVCKKALDLITKKLEHVRN